MPKRCPFVIIILLRLALVISLFSSPSSSGSSIFTNASLYPTKPVASTTYRAGRVSEIQWKEDGKTPKLGEYCNPNTEKGIVVELVWGDEVRVTLVHSRFVVGLHASELI